MNILYLGAFPPKFLIERSGGKIDSLYRDSEPLIQGLRELNNVNLQVITSPDVASWPNGPFFIAGEKNKEERLILVSSLNISFVKQLWTIICMTLAAIRCIRKNNGKTIVIIPYVVFRHVFTLRLLHFLLPDKVIQACVVPDIFFPRKRFSKMINSFTEQMASRFDAFVLYTAKMAEHLGIEKDRYIIIEGFRKVLERKPSISDGFKLVYAGSLNINYGIGRLIEAMSLIDDSDVQLHLYGAGSAEEMIKDISKHDDRVVFHGRVTNTEATDAIYCASALINPRNSHDGSYTEYSFPSKDIEYMSTGIPTLLCKLPGMPSEYYGHFVDMGDASPREIADSIIKVKKMSLTERMSIGEDARRFITDRMNPLKQAERISSLFMQVMGGT